MGAAAVPLIISAVSSGVGMLNQRRAMKAQDKAAVRQIDRQRGRQQEANAAMQAELDRMAGSSPDAARRQSQAEFMEALRGARGQADAATPGAPGASDRFNRTLADRVVASDEEAGAMADIMASIGAPARQRDMEGQRQARLGTHFGQLSRFAQGDDFTTRMRIQNTRSNPWVDMAAQAGQTYAGWLAGRAPAGKVAKPGAFDPGGFTSTYLQQTGRA